MKIKWRRYAMSYYMAKKLKLTFSPYYMAGEKVWVDGEKFRLIVKVCERISQLGLDGLDAIVLFGSVARGEEDRRSDVDLLLLYEDEEQALRAEDVTARVCSEFPDLRLSIINKGCSEAASNPYFLFEVLRDGIVLYKRPSTLPLKAQITQLRPFYIYVFDLKGLDDRRKAAVTVALYGRRRGLKRQRGVLETVGGVRLGRGAIMVPADHFRRIEAFFEFNNVSFRKMAVSYLYGDLDELAGLP